MQLDFIVSSFALLLALSIAHWYGMIDLNCWTGKESKLLYSLRNVYSFPLDAKFTTATVYGGVEIDNHVVVDAVKFLKKSSIRASEVESHKKYFDIQSKENLRDTFEFLVSHGITCSHAVVRNPQLYNELLAIAKPMQQDVPFAGSQATRYATALSFMGIRSSLFTSMKRKSRHALPSNISVYGKEVTTHVDSIVLQWPANVEWGETASQTKPGILHLTPSFGQEMSLVSNIITKSITSQEKEQALLVIGDLHSIVALESENRELAIREVIQNLEKLPKGLKVHLELGSGLEPLMLHMPKLFSLVHSIGTHERDLDEITRAFKGPHTDLWHASVPLSKGVVWVVDILRHVFKQLANKKSSRLSRVFFQSPSFHLVVNRRKEWIFSESGLAASSLMQTKFLCNCEEPHADSHDIRVPDYFPVATIPKSNQGHILSLDVRDPVAMWMEDNDLSYYFVPVLVGEGALSSDRIIGLRESVSAAFLANSAYNFTN